MLTPPSKPDYDLTTLLETDMNNPIEPSIIDDILSKPPFISLPGAINIRDLGLLPSSPIPPGLLFRSGSITNITPTDLTSLGIKLILDLRSPREVSHSPSPITPGIQNICLPPTVPPPPVSMPDFLEANGIPAYTAMYSTIMHIYTPSFRTALTWLANNNGPVLFHCSAGKDRTGVLSALLLSLAGASRDTIAHDYALTRVGVETSREMLLQMLKMWNAEWTGETLGVREFVQVKREFILGALEGAEGEFGGVEGYIKGVLGLEEGEVERVRGVLRGEGGVREGDA